MISIPIVICLLLAALVYWWLPKTYRAYALINFGASKVMHVQGVDDSSSSQHSMESQSVARINAVKEVVYGRELLIKVADEFHLYGYDKDHAGQEVADAIAKAMRFAVKLDSKEAPFVRLSFANPDPVVARDATMRLAELFIEENLQSRTVVAESSGEFFQHQLDAMKVQLEKKEQALAQFKQTHLGQLPEQMESNLRVIDRLENEATAQQEMVKSLALRMESIDKAIRE